MWKKLFGSSQDTDTALRRAMGTLYNNHQAHELLRQQLNGRSIESMSDDEIYDLVRSVIRILQRRGLTLA